MRKWNNKNLTIQTKYHLPLILSLIDSAHDKKKQLYNYNNYYIKKQFYQFYPA